MVRINSPESAFHTLHGHIVSNRGPFGSSNASDSAFNVMVRFDKANPFLPWPYCDGHAVGFSDAEVELVPEMVAL